MSGRVVVVGSVNVDLVVTTEHLPGPGETVIGGRFARHHGGKGGNQAVAAARLGAATSFVGAVGGDAFGTEARAALEAEGVDVAELLTIPAEATGVALIVVDAAGENSIAVSSGANAALSSVQVRAALKRLALTSADVVLVGHEIRTGATHEALRLGRIAGATTILNPAPVGGLEPPTLALADVLTPNDGELVDLTDGAGSPTTRAKRLLGLDPGTRAVLVSQGAKGALFVADGRAQSIPPPRVDIVDTVGAGDTLNGVLAAGLASGLDRLEAARRAVVAASLAVRRAGAREGMPTSEELEQALGQAIPAANSEKT
ncbi:MAG: ribokinase [Chloroflexi bacterium]|nr:ribokinase [Chloroflexota bacterium]